MLTIDVVTKANNTRFTFHDKSTFKVEQLSYSEEELRQKSVWELLCELSGILKEEHE